MAYGAGWAASLPIGQATERAEAWSWAERRLFEVVGALATTSAHASCKIYFDACSQHHAWRSRLWTERLQSQPGQALRTALGEVGPPTSGRSLALASQLEESLAVFSGIAGDVGRLAAYSRVLLARSVVGYRAWQRSCGPSADKPVERALSFVTADVSADWEDGESLLAEILDEGGEAAVRAASEAVAIVEGPLVAGLGQFL
jgi:hypothetical protein